MELSKREKRRLKSEVQPNVLSEPSGETSIPTPKAVKKPKSKLFIASVILILLIVAVGSYSVYSKLKRR